LGRRPVARGATGWARAVGGKGRLIFLYSARAELSMAIVLYRAMDMHFWLPQAEAALAQTGGAGPV